MLHRRYEIELKERAMQQRDQQFLKTLHKRHNALCKGTWKTYAGWQDAGYQVDKGQKSTTLPSGMRVFCMCQTYKPIRFDWVKYRQEKAAWG
jgi:hypothetical protein